MNRRTYLATVATGTAAIAGCLSQLEQSDDDKANRIAELEAEIDELQDDLQTVEEREQDLANEIQHLETREAELESEIDALEADAQARTDLVEERLKTLYQLADDYYIIGENEWEGAINYWNDDDFVGAASFFGTALARYDTVTDLTYEIEGLAVDEGYDEAAEIALDANAHAHPLRHAAEQYSLAAEYYALGQDRNAEEAFEAAEEYVEEAEQYSFESVRRFENSL